MSTGRVRKFDVVEAKRMYEEEHMSCSMIAPLMGVGRQAVWKALRQVGVDTRKMVGTRVRTWCDFCGGEINWTRSRWRGTRHHFCSKGCYFNFFRSEHPNYWRHGCRVGREILRPFLGKVYGEVPEFTIHHDDGNGENNSPDNLYAFPDHSNHMKWHRGGMACVLLSGRNFLYGG